MPHTFLLISVTSASSASFPAVFVRKVAIVTTLDAEFFNAHTGPEIFGEGPALVTSSICDHCSL
jgi:hypothetical protein